MNVTSSVFKTVGYYSGSKRGAVFMSREGVKVSLCGKGILFPYEKISFVSYDRFQGEESGVFRISSASGDYSLRGIVFVGDSFCELNERRIRAKTIPSGIGGTKVSA